MSREERKSPENGIWLCEYHARLIDNNDPMYTVPLLQDWKAQAQSYSWLRVRDGIGIAGQDTGATGATSAAAITNAAARDFDGYRRASAWPNTVVPLLADVAAVDHPVDPATLASAVVKIDDLVVSAGPGMGKTTAVLQITRSLLEGRIGCPFIVPLSAWATDVATMFEWVLKRPAYSGLTLEDVWDAAGQTDIVLLLDGWNELDGDGRSRACVEIERLRSAEQGIRIVLTTRNQTADLPLSGTLVGLLPLSDGQQAEIAREIAGDRGERRVQVAWETPGLRDLVRIPLYLTALLELPDDFPTPTTREEALRLFVRANEASGVRVETLRKVTRGMQKRYLEHIASSGIRNMSQVLVEADARKAVTECGTQLVEEGQISVPPQPDAVLAALVGHHVLTLMGQSASYEFQHHQFQEWFASNVVERLMKQAASGPEARKQLQHEILDLRAWEEPVLFACERIASCEEEDSLNACGAAVLAAFQVDPMLAAEMVHRSGDRVWSLVGVEIQRLLAGWHRPGTVDQAFEFMMVCGREEFLAQVWPLMVANEKQTRLRALRAGSPFRASVLGKDAVARLSDLPPQIKADVVTEMAYECEMDGVRVAMAVAERDPDSSIKSAVAETLAFRGVGRLAASLVASLDDEAFASMALRSWIEEIPDDAVQDRLTAARAAPRGGGRWGYRDISSFLSADNDVRASELTRAIAELEMGDDTRDGAHMIHEASRRFPVAVADGLLHRLKEGRLLPYGVSELIQAAALSVEDEELLAIAMNAAQFDDRADAAAAALGPVNVGRLIDAWLHQQREARSQRGHMEGDLADRLSALRGRIDATQVEHLVAAIESRSSDSDHEKLSELANLIVGRLRTAQKPLPTSPTGAVLAGFVVDWGTRMADTGDANREQLASIATLAECTPSKSMLPVLKRLLDIELSRWRTLQIERTRNRMVPISWLERYADAFVGVTCSEATDLMCGYLTDEHFGAYAAGVLAAQWRNANEPSSQGSWPDFSRVKGARAMRLRDPRATSPEAEAIFSAIATLTSAPSRDEIWPRAVALANAAVTVPHGERAEALVALLDRADRDARCTLLTNLVLSGVVVDAEVVRAGLTNLIEAGQTDAWLLTDSWRLSGWLQLIPFTSRPSTAPEILGTLPESCRRPSYIEPMLRAFKFALDDDTTDVLLELAKVERQLYGWRAWREAVAACRTASAGRGLVDLAIGGAFEEIGSEDRHGLVHSLAEFMQERVEVRQYVYERLSNASESVGATLLARAVAESPDEQGFWTLFRRESAHGNRFITNHTIEKLLTIRTPLDAEGRVFSIDPSPAIRLRQRLLAEVTDGGPSDLAARYLRDVDQIRSIFGVPESEPRHPNLASGKPWPIVAG